MSGRKAKVKGVSFERAVVKALQDAGLAATRVPLSGSAGGPYSGDIDCPVLGADRKLECKRRARAFGTLYQMLGPNYALVIRDDRTEPLVVQRFDDWARLARGAG